MAVIHKRQKIETTQMCIDEWIDKQNVVYRKEILTYYPMDEPRVYHAEWNNPVAEGQTL